MKRIEAFFALIRAGLWAADGDDAQLGVDLFKEATEEDWEALYRMAVSQTLVAICFDGVQRLPMSYRPQRALYLQWAAKTAQVENANRRLNEMVNRVVKLCTSKGIRPVLLKGQAMAACYEVPLHRQCGDIDLFVGRADAERTVQLLEEAGAKPSGEVSYKHTCLVWEGIHLEIHRMVGRLNAPLANHHMQRWVREWYPHSIGWRQEMPVPDQQFELFFIFQHAFMHFLNSGIGLRQLCDWARLLYTLHRQVEVQVLEGPLRQMGLFRAAQVFGSILVHQLGLPAEAIPFVSAKHPALEQLLMEEIFSTGNFGQWDTRIAPRPKGYWRGKWHTFTRALRRCRTLYQFAPAEACFYPLVLIQGTLIIQYNRLRSKLLPYVHA